jgi:ankyrin repeat protein
VVNRLIKKAVEIHFFDLKDDYSTCRNPDGSLYTLTELSATYVTLLLDGKTKRIRDYICAPNELVDFEREIERDVNSHQWLHQDTLQSSSAVASDVFSGIKLGFTKLMTSAGAGDLNGVKRDLDAGEKINATDESGWTALMIAAARIQVPVVKLLLSAGADPSMKDKNGDTALIGAAAGRWFNEGSNEGQAEVIKLLVASGADPDASNNNGSTALMLAAQSGNPDAVRTLLKSGSNPSRENSYGFTALRYAEHASSEPKNEEFQNNFGEVVTLLKNSNCEK